MKNGLKYSDRLEDEEIGDNYYNDDGNEYYDYDNGIYYYEDDYGNTWAKCENLYDLPDYKATDNDDSGITVFFAPKAEKLTAMEKEYTEALNDMYRAKLFVIVFGVIEFMLVCYLLLICAYNAEPESVERWKQGNFLKKSANGSLPYPNGIRYYICFCIWRLLELLCEHHKKYF